MVEHTRAHPRLKEQSPPGRREKLALGTLFLPAGMKTANGVGLLFFFHGGTWLPEVAAAQNKMAVVTVQAGSGSGDLRPPVRRSVALSRPAEGSGDKGGRAFRPHHARRLERRLRRHSPDSENARFVRAGRCRADDRRHPHRLRGRQARPAGIEDRRREPGDLAATCARRHRRPQARHRDALRNFSRHVCQHHGNRRLPVEAVQSRAVLC